MADRSRALRAILLGGLIAGTFDISYAFIYYYLRVGATPVRILQSVASGALGASARTGGLKTAALGLFFHFLIATMAAAVYYLASRRLQFLVNQAIVCGLLYGAGVYAFMNLVVIPLSAIPTKQTYPWLTLITGLLIHMFGIGLPIALITRRYSK